MKKGKAIREKVIASFLAASMVCTLMPATALAVDGTEELPLLAEFTFDDTETGFKGGQAKTSRIGTPAVQETDGRKALYLDGSSYLDVTNLEGGSLLAGQEQITVSYDAKPDLTNSGNWVMFAAPNADTQEYLQERYIGILAETGGTTKVERYNQTDPRTEAAIAATGSDWVHVDVVFSENATTIYLNGEKAADGDNYRSSVSSDFSLPEILGNNGILYIGKANWVNGEYYKGYLDSYRIYGTALTDEQIADQYEEYFWDGVELPSAVEEATQLTLPSVNLYGDSISWTSGNTSVIANDGTVTLPEQDTTVKMTAKSGGYTKTFDIQVRKVLTFTDALEDTGGITLRNGGALTPVSDTDNILEVTTGWIPDGNSPRDGGGAITDAASMFRTDGFTLFVKVKPNSNVDANMDKTSLILIGTESNYVRVTPAYTDGNSYLITKSSGGAEVRVPFTPVSTTDWTDIALVYDKGAVYVYVNGELAAQNETTGLAFENLDGIGASFGCTYATGFMRDGQYDNIVAANAALSADEVKAETEAREQEQFDSAVAAYTIPDADNIRGNISLPEEVEFAGVAEKVSVEWTSSDDTVITDTETDGKAAGVVTRQEEDTEVTLKAVFTFGTWTAEKEIKVTVKAAPADQEDTTAYMFAHFTGTEGSATDEQIYFAVSEDGVEWDDMRENGDPVLSSDIGDRGVRDPYIIRSPEGDTFYLIATDLSIYYRGGWGNAQATTTGSTNLVVWQSNDLVTWSEPRLVDVAGDIPGAGCAWAPEAFYDENTGNYVVYWATGSDESNENGDRMNVYYATTRDFYTFSEPVLWIDRNNSVIDTTMIQVGDTYYRASGDGQITIDKSNSIYEGWETIGTLSGIFDNSGYSGAMLEGPEFFKYNEDDWLPDEDGNPVETWGLMCDQYAQSLGYLPFRTTDIGDMSTDSWSTASDINLGVLKKRHGSILPITQEEYSRIRTEIGGEGDVEEKILAQFDFDDETTGFQSENAKATGNHTLTDSYDSSAGQALYLDGSSDNFLTVTDANGSSLLTGATELTISYEAKPDQSSTTNWIFYAAPNGNQQVYNSESYIGILEAGGSTKVERYNNSGSRPTNPSAATGTDWVHVDVVLTRFETIIYVNGVKQAEQNSGYRIESILGNNSIVQIGKANWTGSGEYFKGLIDNVTIRNKALDEESVKALSEAFLSTQPMVMDAVVGTAPDRETALTYRGTDDHTAVFTQVDAENKEIISYVRNSADTAKLPVTLTFNGDVEILADGQTVENGSEFDLSEDLEVTLRRGEDSEVWTLKAAIVSNNPALPGQYADPDIDYMDGKFWIFPTTDGYSGWSGTQFHAWSSEDLVNWTDEGIIMDVADDNPGENENGVQIAASTWSVGSAWAPTIEEKDGKYYFYYCAKFSNGTSAIGVASADDPAGPYTDKGEALMTVDMCRNAGVNMGQAIDPSIFTDDDGTSYILFGNGSAAIAELNDDMMSIKEGSIRQINGLTDFRESVVVTKVGDKYHWTWSCDDANSPNYHVNYGVTDTLFDDNGNVNVTMVKDHLLAKDESMGILGSAHQSVVHVQDTDGNDRYFMAYHRFYTPVGIFTSSDGLGVHRETCIDEITFDENGYMQITPTLEGVEPQPEPALESIELSGDVKTEYELGEALDLSGLTVTAVYSDGTRTEIQAGEDGYIVSGYDPNAVGPQTVTVSYGGKTAEFTVTVTESEEPAEPTLESIELSGDVKTEYNQGEALDLSGLTVTAVYSNGTRTEIQAGEDGYTVSGYDPNAVGPQTVTVSYGGKTAEFTVTVTESEEPAEPTLEKIELSGDVKKEYNQGEALDLSGLTVTAVYSDGSRTEIQAGEGGYTVSGYDPDTVGEQTVTITYGGESAAFTVMVAEKEEPTEPGEPSDPSEPGEPSDPSEPGEPSGPSEPTDPAGPSDPEQPSDSQNGDGTDAAVQTGDSTNLLLPAGGMLMAAVLLFVVWEKKRFRK